MRTRFRVLACSTSSHSRGVAGRSSVVIRATPGRIRSSALSPQRTERRSAPSVVNDIVVAGTADGNLVVWDRAGCGASTCAPAASLVQGGAVGPVSPIDHALMFTVGGSVRKLVAPNTSS